MSFMINPYRFGSGAADSLLTDLVAWWSMDETTGTRVNAHNPGTHDLTETNGVGYISGVQGNAADFAGSGAEDMLTASHHADFVIGDTPFSIAGWCLMSSSSESNCRIIIKQNPAVSGGEWSVQRISTLQAVILRVRNAANSATTDTPQNAITYGSFFFFIAEHDPDTNEIAIEVNRGTRTTAAFSGGVYSGTNDITFGRVATNDELDGALDEVVIARRLWTTDEKDRLYNSGSGMAYPG